MINRLQEKVKLDLQEIKTLKGTSKEQDKAIEEYRKKLSENRNQLEQLQVDAVKFERLANQREVELK